MASFNDLSNEVLTKIRPSPYDLFAIVHVNRPFYNVYSPQLYHLCILTKLFGTNQPPRERKKMHGQRYLQLLRTIIENPLLASHIKRLQFDYHHSRIVTDYANEETYPKSLHLH